MECAAGHSPWPPSSPGPASERGDPGPPSLLRTGACCSSLQPPCVSQRAPLCRPPACRQRLQGFHDAEGLPETARPLAVSLADCMQEKPPPVPWWKGHWCTQERRLAASRTSTVPLATGTAPPRPAHFRRTACRHPGASPAQATGRPTTGGTQACVPSHQGGWWEALSGPRA